MSFAKIIPKKKQYESSSNNSVPLKSVSSHDLAAIWGISKATTKLKSITKPNSYNNLNVLSKKKALINNTKENQSIALITLTVDEVIQLFHHLEVVFNEETIRNNKINGKTLSKIDSIDDFFELEMNMPTPKARCLLIDIIKFKNEGISEDLYNQFKSINITDKKKEISTVLQPLDHQINTIKQLNKVVNNMKIEPIEISHNNNVINENVENYQETIEKDDRGKRLFEAIASIESVVFALNEFLSNFQLYTEDIISDSINKMNEIIMQSKSNQIALGKQGGCARVNELLKKYHSTSYKIALNCLGLIATLCRLDGNINTANNDNINYFLKAGCCEGK